MLQTVQKRVVYIAVYGTVHYKKPLKSFEIRVGYSPGFWFPSVAIMPLSVQKATLSNIHLDMCSIYFPYRTKYEQRLYFLTRSSHTGHTCHILQSNYIFSAIWGDTDIRHILKTTTQRVRMGLSGSDLNHQTVQTKN